MTAGDGEISFTGGTPLSVTPVNLRLQTAIDGQYEVWLIGSGGAPGDGLDLPDRAVIPRRVASGKIVAGLVTPLLPPTSQVTPAGTVYRADLFAVGAHVAEQLYFTVPDSAVAVEAVDWVTVVPGSLGPVDTEDGGTTSAGSVLMPSPIFTLPSAPADAASSTPTSPGTGTGFADAQLPAVSRRSSLLMLATLPYLRQKIAGNALPAAVGAGAVTSVNTRTGDVTGLAEQTSLDTTNSNVATNAALIAGKQAADDDLTTIAALDATIAGALVTDGAGWIRQTYTQLKTALGLVKADIGLSSVDNTADIAKPVSTAQQAALDAKVAASTLGAANGVATLDGAGKVTAAQDRVTSVDGAEGAVSLSDTYVAKAGSTSSGEQAAPSLKATGKTGATETPITLAGGTASGAPTTGAHIKGEFVLDDTGAGWYCTVAGTPGTWVASGGGGNATSTSYVASHAAGLVGDAKQITDAAMTSGSAVLTSAAGLFTPADVGKVIVLSAGAVGAKLQTTIASYQSATRVTLANAASLTFTARGASWGTDNGPALQTILNNIYALGGGTRLQLPPGKFLVKTPVLRNFVSGSSSIVISGEGSATQIIPACTDAETLITLQNLHHLVIEKVTFVGTPDVLSDAKIMLRIGGYPTLATIRDCDFYGLGTIIAAGAIIQANACDLTLERTAFRGCSAASGISVPVVDVTAWLRFGARGCHFIDFGVNDGIYHSKTPIAGAYAWIRLGNTLESTLLNAYSQAKATFSDLTLDEGALFGVMVQPGEVGRAAFVECDGVNVNCYGAGIWISNTDKVLVRNCFLGYRSLAVSAADALYFDRCGNVVVEGVVTGQNAKTIRVIAPTTSLTLIDSIYTTLVVPSTTNLIVQKGGASDTWSIPRTYAVGSSAAYAPVAASQTRYMRLLTGGVPMSKVAVDVGVQSGNIAVAVYRNSGVGKAARPTGGRLATSGSVACPAVGYQEIDLGATIVPQPGDWVAIATDNATVTLLASSSTTVSSRMARGGSGMGTENVYPPPVTPNIGAWLAGAVYYLRGVGVGTTPPEVPDAPTIGTATAGNTTASVPFTPGLAGTNPTTGYTATASPGGQTVTATASPISFTGLTNNITYTFTVHASSVDGNSSESAASNGVTPAGVVTAPGAPTIGTATSGDTSASVTWTAPTDNGGSPVTGYTVTPYIGPAAQTPTTVGNVLSTTITGLTNGTAYTFKVAAINAVGTGGESAASNSVTANFTPAGYSNLVHWLEADAVGGSPANGAALSTWADQSTSAKNATQATTSKKPIFQASVAAFNNKPTVRFVSASAQQMDTASPASTLLNNYTHIIVCSASDVSAIHAVFFNGARAGNGRGLYPSSGSGAVGARGRISILQGGVAWQDASTAPPAAAAIYMFKRTAGVTTLFLNGVQQTILSPSSASAGIPTVATSIGGDGTYFHTGDVALEVSYDAVRTTAELNAIGAAYATKYGFTWTTIV